MTFRDYIRFGHAYSQYKLSIKAILSLFCSSSLIVGVQLLIKEIFKIIRINFIMHDIVISYIHNKILFIIKFNLFYTLNFYPSNSTTSRTSKHTSSPAYFTCLIMPNSFAITWFTFYISFFITNSARFIHIVPSSFIAFSIFTNLNLSFCLWLVGIGNKRTKTMTCLLLEVYNANLLVESRLKKGRA